MVRVDFLGPIGLDSMSLEIENLSELKDALSDVVELKRWLPISAVAINDEIVEKIDVALKDGDCISILPPVCGG